MREASSRADIGRIEETNTKCCDKSGMRMFGMSYNKHKFTWCRIYVVACEVVFVIHRADWLR